MLRSARRKRRPLRIEELEDRHLLTTVYEQLAVSANAGYVTSSKGADGLIGWQTFDNFRLYQRAVITDTTWRGFYLDYVKNDNNPVSANTITWNVSFWSDAAGSVQPENILYAESLPAGSVTTAFVGIQKLSLREDVAVYDFTAHLAIPFLAEADTTYWFSPLSRAAVSNPLFGWAPSKRQDNRIVQDKLPTGGRSFRFEDRAFSLAGSSAAAPVLTVITHGYLFDIGEPNPADSSFAPWVTDMAVAIEDKLKLSLPAGEKCISATIVLSRFVAGGEPSAAACKHFLIPIWNSDRAGPEAREEIVQTLYELIVARAEKEPIDLHLIGHSRGAVVNSEVVRLLKGWSGKDWLGYVQVTTLDPHPDKLIYLDPEPMDYDIVNFADNYYQQGGRGPDGRSIEGALNVDLSMIVDEDRGGWDGRSGFSAEHSEVHDWYHWTIDTSDDESPSLNDNKMQKIDLATRQEIYPLTAWNNGKKVGYYWSIIGKGWNDHPTPIKLLGREEDLHVSITAPEGVVTIFQTASMPTDPLPNGFDPPRDMLNVIASQLDRGSAISLTFYLDYQANSYVKYGPTKDTAKPHWYEFLYDEATKTGAVIENNVATVYFIDGSRGDDDGKPNGIIIDPGVPVFDRIPWHNRNNPLDVGRNNSVEPLDALLIVNDLHFNGSRRLPLTPKTADRRLIDTNGDGFVAPGDAVVVINYLNELARQQYAGEGELPRFVFAGPENLGPAMPSSRPLRIYTIDWKLTPTEDYFKRYPGTKPDLKSVSGSRSYIDADTEEDWDDDLLELLSMDQLAGPAFAAPIGGAMAGKPVAPHP